MFPLFFYVSPQTYAVLPPFPCAVASSKTFSGALLASSLLGNRKNTSKEVSSGEGEMILYSFVRYFLFDVL